MRFLFWRVFRLAIVACCLSLSIRLVAQAQDTTWRTKRIALHCSNATMQQALEQLAAQAGISILADGIPNAKRLNIETQATAENTLTQIADTFDYSWTLSKTGFVLMQKRFTDEHERPEVVPDEMRAATRNILSLMQPFYSAQSGESMTSVFRKIIAGLSSEESKKANSMHGLPVAELQPDLQPPAIHLLYMNEMDALSRRLDELNKMLVALPEARIMSADVLFGDGKNHKCVVLAFAPSSEIRATLLWDPERRETLPSAKEAEAAMPISSAVPSLAEAFTIEEAFARLQTRCQISATVLPKMRQQRQIMLLLHDADAPQAPTAFAELYNWRLQHQDNAVFLYPQPVVMPQSISELGKAILNALPADVARSLFTRPTTLGGEKYVDIHDNFPQLPGKGDARPYALTKTRLLDTLPRLRRSFSATSLDKPLAYQLLSADQQRDLVYHLWSFTAAQIVDSLWKLAFRPPSRVTDPLHARLLRHGVDAFSMIGSGGDRVQVQSGPN